MTEEIDNLRYQVDALLETGCYGDVNKIFDDLRFTATTRYLMDLLRDIHVKEGRKFLIYWMTTLDW